MEQRWPDPRGHQLPIRRPLLVSHHGGNLPKKLGEIDQQQSGPALSATAPRRQIGERAERRRGKKFGKNSHGGRRKNVERSNWQFELGMGHPHLHPRQEMKKRGGGGQGGNERPVSGSRPKRKWSRFSSVFLRAAGHAEGRNEKR